MRIPLSKPFIPQKVFENINKVLATGKLSGDGVFCHESEEKLRNILNIHHALLTTSCTHALEMSMQLLDVQINDEVILPSFTFSSTANAVLSAGLKPIFCEIDPLTMNMDMNDVSNKITKKTKAIIPVHYAGVACNMDALQNICSNQKISIIEDAAQAIGATWKEQKLGTIGQMGALSFHDTKNVICGEGGALLTNSDLLAERAKIIREKGTNRSQFIKGQVDKYTWVDKGSSYILAEPLAAILSAELDIVDDLNQKRGKIYNYYLSQLIDLEQKEFLSLPKIPENCQSNYHIFHIILRNMKERNSLMTHLRSKGIGATFHYMPLHSAPVGEKLGYKKEHLPVTEEYAGRLLRLPLYPDLAKNDYENIIEEIFKWTESNF